MNKEYPILFIVTGYNQKLNYIKAKYSCIKKKLESIISCSFTEIEDTSN